MKNTIKPAYTQAELDAPITFKSERGRWYVVEFEDDPGHFIAEEVRAKSPGQACAWIAREYHLDFTHSMSIKVQP